MKVKRLVALVVICALLGTMLLGCSKQTNYSTRPKEDDDTPSLQNKVVYVLGDSIPYLNGSWVESLAEKTGASKVINCSRAGATWAWRDSYESYWTSELLTKEIVATISEDGKTAVSYTHLTLPTT